jgi:hypothetical protein
MFVTTYFEMANLPQLMKHFFTTGFICLICFTSHAQVVKIFDWQVKQDKTISFSCTVEADHSSREEYKIKIFTSADNYAEPLAVEIEKVKAGDTINVNFDAQKTIGMYKGQLEFLFTAEATLFPVQIVETNRKFRRGKTIEISWEDFHDAGWYDVELLKNGVVETKMIGSYRGTKYTTTLPKKMTEGNYAIRISPTNNKEWCSEDYVIAIQPKIGLAVIAGTGALIGTSVLLLSESSNSKNNDLPGPPQPTN